MTWPIDVLIAVGIVVVCAMYLSWRATRIDRLHVRMESARAGLDAALVRRSAIALELAASRVLDPATSLLLATAAHEARTADTDNREFAESDLSRALRAVVEQPGFNDALADAPENQGWRRGIAENQGWRRGIAENQGWGRGIAENNVLLTELDGASQRVAYARSFYNNAVATIRQARRKVLVRVLPLAGSAPLPEFFEIDDTPPKTPVSR